MKHSKAVIALLGLGIVSFTMPGSTATLRAQAPIATSEQIWTLMSGLNAQLDTAGADFRVEAAAYLTRDDSSEAGQIVRFSDRGNKQIGAHYVPGDPRRTGTTNITYTVDQTEGAIDGLTVGQTTAAIDRGMATWDAVNCSTIPIDSVANPGTDLGVVEFLVGLGGSPFVFADITHAGWLPGGLLPNNVIAVTFIFVFVSGGVPTDINNDGDADTAFAEILYNNFFNWQINGNIDVETVALHESGHGLSQGHFGKLFQTTSNGRFHFAPRAVMNAGYTGVQQNLAGTDNAGHCSIWASWPNH